MASGALVSAVDAEEGAHVQFFYSEGLWYDATILKVWHDDDSAHVNLHYRGFGPRRDDWQPLADGNVRWPLAGYDFKVAKNLKLQGSSIGLAKDGKVPQYVVECLLDKRCVGKKRKVQYLVRWEGYGETEDRWLSEKHIADDIIDAYEKPCRGNKRPTRAKKLSVTRQQSAGESEEVQQQRRRDAEAILKCLAVGSATRLRYTSHCKASVELAKFGAFIPGNFIAMHEHLVSLKTTCGVTAEDAVTPIVRVDNGARPADGFTLWSWAILDRLMMDALPKDKRISGTLSYPQTGGNAFLLVPPFEFTWRNYELTVVGHIAALVEDLANPGRVDVSCDDQNFQYMSAWKGEYITGFGVAMARLASTEGAPTVPQWILDSLQAHE